MTRIVLSEFFTACLEMLSAVPALFSDVTSASGVKVGVTAQALLIHSNFDELDYHRQVLAESLCPYCVIRAVALRYRRLSS